MPVLWEAGSIGECLNYQQEMIRGNLLITEIGLTNFQGFKGPQISKLAPITLIFGPNASGKSSISRAIRLMRQSGPTDIPSTGLEGLRFAGNDIDLNSLENVRFGQNLAKPGEPFSISVSGNFRQGEPATQGFSGYSVRVSLVDDELGKGEGPGVEFETTFWFSEALSDGRKLGISLSGDNHDRDIYPRAIPEDGWPELEERLSTFCENAPLGEFEADVTASPDAPAEESLKAQPWADLMVNDWHLLTRDNVIYPESYKPDELLSFSEKRKLNYIQQLSFAARLAFRAQLRGVKHIGPFREIPSRVAVNTHERRDPESLKKANMWLGKLTDERYQVVSTQSIFESQVSNFQVTENFVIDSFTKTSMGFENVGTGISQVFPLLLELFSPASNPASGTNGDSAKIIFVEQPELHLHPRMQGDLADALIFAIRSNSWDTQIVAETHSENLLLRLQKRIREGALRPEEVEIIFVEPTSPSEDEGRFNTMSNIALDEAGDVLDPFPVSFAALRVEDLF